MFFSESYNELITTNEECFAAPSSAESNQLVRAQNSTRTWNARAHPTTAGLACLQQQEHHRLLCQLQYASLHPLPSSLSDLDYFPVGRWLQRPLLKVSPRNFDLSIGLISRYMLIIRYYAQNFARSCTASSLITLSFSSLHNVSLKHLYQPQSQ